jgi:uncharacterized protein (TIGR00297 family)
MDAYYPAAIIIITAGVLISILKEKLTVKAAFTGAFLSMLIFWGAGFTGLALLTTFFILGSGATAWKLTAKKQAGLAESRNGKRNAGQVLANAGVAAILALFAKCCAGTADMVQLMIASAFSAAAADTLSSELGNVYGKRYYHILSFQKMQRGANGAISLQGSIAGIAGSTIIALVYACATGWNAQQFLIIILAGTIGNVADTVLGLTLENRHLLTNNMVNFLNTLAGAITAWILYRIQVPV